MVNPQGKCIYCGGLSLSKEHIFADWLKKYFPRTESTGHTFGTMDPSSVIGLARIDERERQGHVGSIRIRVVCKNCNNGWLSGLEKAVKPTLVPMITGDRCNLTPERQKTLATWASKTVMIADRSKPRADGIHDNERNWLRENLAPPTNWAVWIANYSGGSWSELGMGQSRGNLQNSSFGGPNVMKYYIHATTFGMGKVVFLVIGTTWDEAPEFFNRIHKKGLFQICPSKPQSILWPPIDTLDDSDVNGLANLLTQSGAFDNSFNPLADWSFTM